MDYDHPGWVSLRTPLPANLHGDFDDAMASLWELLDPSPTSPHAVNSIRYKLPDPGDANFAPRCIIVNMLYAGQRARFTVNLTHMNIKIQSNDTRRGIPADCYSSFHRLAQFLRRAIDDEIEEARLEMASRGWSLAHASEHLLLVSLLA